MFVWNHIYTLLNVDTVTRWRKTIPDEPQAPLHTDINYEMRDFLSFGENPETDNNAFDVCGEQHIIMTSAQAVGLSIS